MKKTTNHDKNENTGSIIKCEKILVVWVFHKFNLKVWKTHFGLYWLRGCPPQIKQKPNSLNEVLELHGVTSNLRAIKSKEEFEVRRRVEEVLANEAPSIKQQTSLHKIFWYRIWLFLVLQGVLKKDSFFEHYDSWREYKGARYFEVLCSFENQAESPRRSHSAEPID